MFWPLYVNLRNWVGNNIGFSQKKISEHSHFSPLSRLRPDNPLLVPQTIQLCVVE